MDPGGLGDQIFTFFQLWSSILMGFRGVFLRKKKIFFLRKRKTFFLRKTKIPFVAAGLWGRFQTNSRTGCWVRGFP